MKKELHIFGHMKPKQKDPVGQRRKTMNNNFDVRSMSKDVTKFLDYLDDTREGRYSDMVKDEGFDFNSGLWSDEKVSIYKTFSGFIFEADL